MRFRKQNGHAGSAGPFCLFFSPLSYNRTRRCAVRKLHPKEHVRMARVGDALPFRIHEGISRKTDPRCPGHQELQPVTRADLVLLAQERIPVTALGVEDRFGEVGKLPYLREAMGLTLDRILVKAREAAALK